jgi:hypothetical protein
VFRTGAVGDPTRRTRVGSGKRQCGGFRTDRSEPGKSQRDPFPHEPTGMTTSTGEEASCDADDPTTVPQVGRHTCRGSW